MRTHDPTGTRNCDSRFIISSLCIDRHGIHSKTLFTHRGRPLMTPMPFSFLSVCICFQRITLIDTTNLDQRNICIQQEENRDYQQRRERTQPKAGISERIETRNWKVEIGLNDKTNMNFYKTFCPSCTPLFFRKRWRQFASAFRVIVTVFLLMAILSFVLFSEPPLGRI